jgi:hypothetical protein
MTDKLENNPPKKNGGARPGSGRPRHSKNPATIEREEALRQFKEKVAKNAQRLFNNQMHLAEGVSYLYRIHTNSKGVREKPELITSTYTIEHYLSGELDEEKDDYYFITTERPDNKAIDSMLDRTFGRAAQSIDVTSDGESLSPINKLSDEELNARIQDYIKRHRTS